MSVWLSSHHLFPLLLFCNYWKVKLTKMFYMNNFIIKQFLLIAKYPDCLLLSSPPPQPPILCFSLKWCYTDFWKIFGIWPFSNQTIIIRRNKEYYSVINFQVVFGSLTLFLNIWKYNPLWSIWMDSARLHKQKGKCLLY